jgi:ketosteroid isomerase-like protein
MGAARDAAEGFYARFAAGDFAGVTACFGADCSTVTPAGTMSPSEHEGFARAFKQALPDAQMAIEKAVEAGPEVFIAGRFRGTHTADLVTPQGTLPASGNRLDLPYADYFKVEGGKIVEHRVFWDQMDMMAQLGAAPPR